MRRFASVLALLAAAAALAGCGTKEKLSDEQAKEFNSQAAQFSEAMTKLNSRAGRCSRKASSGDVTAVADCFARIFDDIAGNFDEISGYVAGLSGEVEGACSARLKKVSRSLGDVSEQFAGAARDLEDGDVSNLDDKLGDKRLDEIGPALDAAEKACT